MKKLNTTLWLLGCLALLNGCGVGLALRDNIQGQHYLQTKEFRRGEQVFRQAVREQPNQARPNFYLGRFLLAGNKPGKALPYLEKAVRLDPDDNDYRFWLGFAYGVLGKLDRERQQYEQVLADNPRHLQSLISLGHNQFKRKKYEQALATYQQVLKIWPASPSALYNRALIARILGRRAEEKTGWLTYLAAYPSGALAIRATNHLNALGDFRYRNHRLGARTITLTKIWFRPFSDEISPGSYPSLDVIGATATNRKQGRLQVLVYLENDPKLARKRAIQIKKYLLDNFSGLHSRDIGISWFGQPEVFRVEGRKVRVPDSVRFFLSDLKPAGKNRAIRARKRKTAVRQ